ncbi:MAG TPA: DUF1501 domain-containing protein, partial [Planctomycetaceae bacterium]|nr:DUF1501 domain-containing protein [Planctomycetaceae bacterium]
MNVDATIKSNPVDSHRHPALARRALLQAGGIGLLGLGMHHLGQLRALASPGIATARRPPVRSVVFVFLSGGAPQHDTFDPKPEAPDNIRGDFGPIATQTPGVEISEHLPRLAQRSSRWALCRSLGHKSDDHDAGHQIMLSGRSDLPSGFKGFLSQATNWPAIA